MANQAFANAARFEGDFAQAADHYREIVADGLQASDALSYFLAYALLAGLERLCGRPLAAQKLVAQAAAEHERLPESTPLLGVVLVQAALAQFELGQVDAALDTVAEAMPLSEHMGQLETSAELHHVRARALALRGEGKAAREAQATAELLLQANVPPDWRGMAEVMALRFARLTDDSTAMRQALVLAQDAHPPLAELRLMLRLERALAHLALGEPAEAQRVVADWPTSLDDAMPVLALAATLAQGAAMLAQNRASEALAALETALISAERHGCVAPFFESGEAVLALVAELSVRVDPALKEAVARVQAISAEVLPSSPQQALIDPLSDRELEILRLIATGLKNKEISAELVISLNTVFYHTKNIYSKLGVHSRSQAIAKATDLNLL